MKPCDGCKYAWTKTVYEIPCRSCVAGDRWEEDEV
jgi:hypothetical protein